VTLSALCGQIRLVKIAEMPRIRLVHWNKDEAREYTELLEGAGHQVEYEEKFRPGLMRIWRESPPDAFVIDLSRLPSHGREIAIALRQSRATRAIPIVFCDGAEEKVAQTRSVLPDATYCARARLCSALRNALKRRITAPVVPTEMMARYAGRTAAQKLGIKESSTIALVDPPREGIHVLGELPNGVDLRDDAEENSDVTLCFIHDLGSLQPQLSEMRRRAGRTKLWVLWKKGGSKKSDSAGRGVVTEGLVREYALALGLVDYKVCSVNEVWSALAFARKR
jgi:CheY-like chemotaxis protein